MNMKKMWAGILAICMGVMVAAPVAAAPSMAEGITKHCKISVSDGDAGVMTDKDVKTYWNPESGHGVVTITLPDRAVGGFSISWFEEPEDFLISAKDKQGSECNRYSKESGFTKIKDYFELDAQVRKITIELQSKKDAISEINVFSQGTLPDTVQRWEDPVEKADLMVISAHQDDELLWFSGTIPEYTVDRGKKTVVVYMADCGRFRRKEALEGLWTMGVKNHPVFNRFTDKRTPTLEEGLALWGGEDAVVGKVVENIRQYKPEVIVTHDVNGEYGHGGHMATAYAAQKAVEAAKDASQYPESAQKYGTWEVKKLYLHLYSENQIQMDWDKPLAAYDGKTGYEVACMGYDMHKSQHRFYQMKKGGPYDNTKFGLAYTAVGLDTGENDFFEHVSGSGKTATEKIGGSSVWLYVLIVLIIAGGAGAVYYFNGRGKNGKGTGGVAKGIRQFKIKR